jgi:hypothetical protein
MATALRITSHARTRYIQRTGHKKEIHRKIFKRLNKSVEVRLKSKYKMEEMEIIGERGARYFLSDNLGFVIKNAWLITVLHGDFLKWQPISEKEIS